jgi:hypothetical protein
MNSAIPLLSALLVLAPFTTQADAVVELQQEYTQQGAGPFSAAAGETLWNSRHTDASDGKVRHCGLCHTDNLRQSGQHSRTGKVIKPMAPSANPKRLTKVKKIKKWLLRNCKWTLGRECTAQEKGNILAFLKSQ